MERIADDDWLYEIKPKGKLINFNFREIWQYRDLLVLFVRRDIVATYKQTILGPLWFLIQPLFTSVIFTLVFNNIADISTGQVPPFLFNLAGITAWNYFKECLTGTSNTFKANAGIFGKVYFPRVIVPLSVTCSNLFKFGIQLLIFALFYLIYVAQGLEISPSMYLLLLPGYVILLGLLGLGLGMIISSMTTKYRDLNVLVGFGVQLLIYISAVMYPLSEIESRLPKWSWLVKWNPLTQLIEGFRVMTLGQGIFDGTMLIYAVSVSILVFLVGLVIFNKTEKTFIDTV